jgi:hypothetical protein
MAFVCTVTSGTTAERPASSASGSIFFDTTIGRLLSWNGSAWADIPTATTSLAGLLAATDKVKLDATSGTNTGDQATNLTVANRGVSTLDLASSTGTAATVPAATGALTGLMAATDKTKLDTVRGVYLWVTATLYAVGDHVNSGDRIYRCTTAHTSGATFAGDLATKWTAVDPASGTVGLVQVADGTGGVTSNIGLSFAASTLTAPNLAVTGTGVITSNATPAVPAAGTLAVWASDIAGRMMLRQMGPDGVETALQPFLARNKIGYWCPPGNAVTVPGVLGYTAPTATGTVTARNVATTNLFTRVWRLGYVSAAAAGSLSGHRVAVAQVTTGTGTLGGFQKILRFGISDAAVVAGARMFVGVSAATGVPVNVEPSTLVNCIGIGHGAADTNLRLFFGAATAGTPINLGVNFPTNTTNVDLYELALTCPPSGGCTYTVTRVNTGQTASGSLAAGVIPASATLLTYQQAWRSNNATAAAVGLDIESDYIGTNQ